MPDQPTGDTAFRAQLIALLPRLRRFAHGLAKSPDEGDELVQAACIRAIERQDQWQAGTRLDSWLYRIIQTIWLDRLRANRIRRDFAEGEAALERTTLTIDGNRDVEAHLTLRRVRQIIDTLPPDQRAVLLLVGIEGFTYREAAETLDIPVGTVMSRLARARAALSEKMTGKGRSAKGVANVPA